MSAGATASIDPTVPVAIAPVSVDRFASVIAMVEEWDLSLLTPTLSAEEGWDAQQCAQAQRAYRQFMAVAACHPGARLSVPATVDAVWHRHILHTLEYFRFCEAIAGRYIHHTPLPAGQVDEGTVDVNPLLEFYFGAAALLDSNRADCDNDPCTSCHRAGAVPAFATRLFDEWRGAPH